jgi:26S proteasome regulatory subunit N1
LAKDLEVYEPKKPEDIFKAHLEEKGKNADISAATSALFQTYVNAFVNAGLKKDTLIIEDPNI